MDVLSDDSYIILDDSNFDFAVNMQYQLESSEPDVAANLDTYVHLMVSQNNFTWLKNQTTGQSYVHKERTRVPLVPCLEGRLGIKNKSEDYLGVTHSYKCPQ